MTTIRKQYSPAFKAEVVQEALKGEKTVNQIASQKGVHPNLVTKWKSAALKAMPNAFDEEGRTQEQIKVLKAKHEKEKEELYAEIGKLTTQLNWLKKKCDTGLAQVEQSKTGRVRR